MSVFDSSPLTPLVIPADRPLLDEGQLAAVAFLARYGGRTLESYRADLRQFFHGATTSMLRRWRRHERTSSSTGRGWTNTVWRLDR